ncbi:MAG: hypothetical protein KGQ70_05395 [Alphaproteobacteria bacterium]|nr:hypothetical protein [Alphaproteobacteria bacterium]
MRLNTRLSAAKATGGVIGVTIAGLSVVAGIGVMVAAPFVGGIAVGMAVAGAVHGSVGVICGVIAGFAAAGISGTIGGYAGLGVMALGTVAGGVIGAAVGGALKLAGLAVKGFFAGAKKLMGLGGKKPVAAAPVVPARENAGEFKANTSKASFDAATTPAAKNDNVPANVPVQKPNAPKL